MILGLLDPWGPLFMDLNIPTYFLNYRKYENTLNTKNVLDVNILDFENENRKGGDRNMMRVRSTES